ncbi:homoserine dehydrogenase [Candidatus Acidianus copahuensis]|uniref:Homoserine dehydrogenase n=1 Tax=Candidatus Acidianus copahuensis TaxID=1160895 RepID=A0A031LLD4_9CREN|nr:homoserine dehydrogenase [Candidatus Acidianus copahuensis]EZQ04867.1 homoserine dehydrogenase [Candidatus Acidianus copahuensis]
MKALLCGFGNVGRAFAEMIESFPDITLSGVVTRKGLMLGKNREFKTHREVSVLEAFHEIKPDIIVDTMSANYKDGEPSYSLYLSALNEGTAVITVNKAPLSLHYSEIVNASKKHNAFLGFQGTVMSGTPSINLRRIMPGQISQIKGILNGTTNYILTRMYEGLDYDNALREAQEKGYAERDPELDVNGFDAAAKITILTNVFFNTSKTIKDVKFEGIKGINSSLIKEKKEKGIKMKLVAKSNGKDVSVTLSEINENEPLYSVDYVTNALEIISEIQNITIIGPGAGPKNAAYGALSDLHIFRGKMML